MRGGRRGGRIGAGLTLVALAACGGGPEPEVGHAIAGGPLLAEEDFLDPVVETFLYREDDAGGRCLASIDVRLELFGDGGQLTLTARASAPGVDPPGGYTGLAGHNRITARELADLESAAMEGADSVLVRTTHVETGAQSIGEFAARARGGVLERRLDDTGLPVEIEAVSATSVTALDFTAPVPEAGAYRTELEVEGRVRLRVDFVLDGPDTRIVRIENPRFHTPDL